MTGPLEGCRVLDLSRILSGPWCTMILSDLGTEVLKVEEPGRGDYSRSYPPFEGGESVYFMGYNRGKRSVNLKHQRGRDLLRSLIPKVDVLVHNYQRDWVYKAGLDYESIKSIKPNLVYCWISAYGEDGPYADKGTIDLIVAGLGPVHTKQPEFDTIQVWKLQKLSTNA